MRVFALFIFVSGILLAQTTTSRFDIADVHVSAPPTTGTPRVVTGGVLRSGRYDLRNITVLDLIRRAYDVDSSTIQGGPDWIEMDHFDIAAKAPQSASSANVKLMLQSLLAERFKLVVHEDMKPVPAYILKLGAKSKLKEASEAGETGCQPGPPSGPAGPDTVICHNESMEAFANLLRSFGLVNPVVDATGLKGGWDFDLKWYERNQISLAGAGAISLFDAIDQQLGLKLDLEKAPSPVLVVDSVNETPTPNAPGVAQALPPQPLEFEVADIKLSTADERPNIRVQPGGRIEIRANSIRGFIELAWNLYPDMIIGNTKGIDNTRFDVVAKTPSVISAGLGTSDQFDNDDVMRMEQALLADRFKLKTHIEERPMPAYTLLAVKPKLTKADPANRPSCKEAPAISKDPRDANPTRSRLVTCLNITMAQFADQLWRFAGDYLHSPVLDSTGVEGRYDITLNFSTAGFLQNSGHSSPQPNGEQSGGAPTAADPGGGISLMDAIKQLGLKLELQKRLTPVLVIDSVEDKPTDN